MTIINIFSGEYCGGSFVAERLAEHMGSELWTDESLILRASYAGGLDEAKLKRAMFGTESVFNKFSHEKERAVAALRTAMAEIMQEDRFVYHGYGAHLVPRNIGHVLDVCLIADNAWRLEMAERQESMEQRNAQAAMRKADQTAHRWTMYLCGKEAWAAELYDILIPVDKSGLDAAVETIVMNSESRPLKTTSGSRLAADDFLLAARVSEMLASHGHDPRESKVSAHRGKVSIEINHQVMMLKRLEEELSGLAIKVHGVREVSVAPGAEYYKADVYRQVDLHVPSKVLLVDDEREFVETLSERLLLREIGSAVVYTGEEALELMADDEPEVIVLDLKMPGMGGVEVLRRVRRNHPAVEVIILTGHGSDRDRETCMNLGAFAYLEKPVDVDELSKAVREAYETIARRS